MRNVIVTGGSRGLGLAITATLAAAGYRVIAVARKETEELRAAVAAVQAPRSVSVGAAVEATAGAASAAAAAPAPESAYQGEIHFRPFDLTNTGAIAAFVSELRKDFGPLYGLVNNAGLGSAGVLTIMRDEQIEELVRLNTLAPIILSKYVVRAMMVERAGRIINISSIVAATGYSGLSAYSATKASLVGFTRSLAREVGQLGITVNAIAPGFVDTEMTNALSGGQREQIMRRSALRRMAEGSDIAHSVEFLLSEKARNITGITLTVDAGNTA